MSLNVLVKQLKGMRKNFTRFIPEQTLDHLQNIRRHELELVVNLLPPEAYVLELGSGTGIQAKILEAEGYHVTGLDIAASRYKKDQVWPVQEYDGHRIPAENDSFDVVFSSNVMEHIPHVSEFQKEIHRVLKPNGIAIHLMPSSTWAFWSNLTALMRHWRLPYGPHGEFASNSIVECYYFRSAWWADLFRDTGWEIVVQDTNHLFYTGSSLFDSHFSMSLRKRLSNVLGSSCNLFVLQKKNEPVLPVRNRIE